MHQCAAYGYADTNPHANANGYGKPHTLPHPYPNRYGYADTHGNRDADSIANANHRAYGDANANCTGNRARQSCNHSSLG